MGGIFARLPGVATSGRTHRVTDRQTLRFVNCRVTPPTVVALLVILVVLLAMGGVCRPDYAADVLEVYGSSAGQILGREGYGGSET